MLPCSAADFAEDLRMMNAKARKKEKRRSGREPLKTKTAMEDAALDAALLYDGESTTTIPPEDDGDSSTDDEADEAADYLMKTLPQTFAVALATRLMQAGHEEPTKMELDTLARIMEFSILPTMEPYILEMRRQEAEGAVIERVSLQFGCKIYTDKTQDEATTKEGDTAAQGAPQQEPAGAVQGSQTDPVQAQQGTGEGAADAAQSTLWEAALDTAKSEGGSADEIQARAAKILRKRKQRIKEKSKAKKPAVIAVA